jgi:hypothetical protein
MVQTLPTLALVPTQQPCLHPYNITTPHRTAPYHRDIVLVFSTLMLALLCFYHAIYPLIITMMGVAGQLRLQLFIYRSLFVATSLPVYMYLIRL